MKYLPQFFPSYWIDKYEVYGIAFTNEISIGFVGREDGGYTYLLKDEFIKLNIKLKELLKSSISNLDEEFENCEIKEYKLSGGSIAFWNSENDNFTAVRFLSLRYLSVLKKIFKDDFYFSIPDRDLITCWQTTDAEEMEKFRNETIEDFENSEYGLSNKIYRFDEIQLKE
jgi:uncharacterized protein YtpQ (UPF0354 family)